jgi:hypothetical protein
MPNYVVLHHTAIENPHYDLMLDLTEGADLATWRIAHWPPRPGDQFRQLPDHRRIYLQYEGAISGNRGEVKRIAEGGFQLLGKDSAQIVIALDTKMQLALPISGS